MPGTYLTKSELRDLTGFVQSGKQIGWLRENRWRYTVTGTGEVRVDRRYYEKRMVGQDESPAARVEPNWSALGG